VVCCADNAADPCNYLECPKNCCGNGICDFAFGTCTCSVGFVSDSCCIECSTLDCDTCLNTAGCGYCTSSKVCTSLVNPACSTPVTNETTSSSICPEQPKVNVAAIVGASLGALALLSAIGAIYLYRRYSTGEYEGFWTNNNKFNEGLNENPLYAKKNIEVESPLYERKNVN